MIITFGILINILSQAQNSIEGYEIGHYIDMNMQIIDGYFDFSYEPGNCFIISYTVGADFTPGYYYDMDGKKTNGLLKYSQSNTYFKFKTSDNEKGKTIGPDECMGYVIGADSFAVIQNFDVYRNLGAFNSKKREFAEVLDKVDSITFYKHIRTGYRKIITTYIIKKDMDNNYLSIPKGKNNFKKTAVDIFGEFEPLKDDIQKGKYNVDDIPTMIKLLKYKKKYDAGERIYFNSSWDEADNYKEYAYYASIESLQDSIFLIKYYFNNDIPICEGNYTSFYPHIKQGTFVFYYPNGIVRKKIYYHHNNPRLINTYFKNGSIHWSYANTGETLFFEKVNDSKGNNILNDSGNGIELFFDSITNRQINYEYINHRLINVHYVDSNSEKVYQLCEKNAKLKSFESLQAKIKEEVDYPINAIKEYNHGYILLKCIIETTGLISDLKLIKGIDFDCDISIMDLLPLLKTDKHWKPGKITGENVKQEIVLPVDFSIKGFSRYRDHYVYWMRKFMLMNTNWMKPPTIPTYTF